MPAAAVEPDEGPIRVAFVSSPITLLPLSLFGPLTAHLTFCYDFVMRGWVLDYPTLWKERIYC